MFEMPATPSCRVIYVKDGVSYAGVLNPTPKDNHELQRRLLDRKIGMSQVQELEPIQPRGDFQYGDPAMNQLNRFVKSSST